MSCQVTTVLPIGGPALFMTRGAAHNEPSVQKDKHLTKEEEKAEIFISIFSLKSTNKRNQPPTQHRSKQGARWGQECYTNGNPSCKRKHLSGKTCFPEHLQISPSGSFSPDGPRIFGCFCLFSCLILVLKEMWCKTSLLILM